VIGPPERIALGKAESVPWSGPARIVKVTRMAIITWSF